MTLFLLLAILFSVAATALLVRPLLTSSSGAPRAAVTVALGLPCAVLLGYMTVSNHGWNSVAPGSGPAPPPGTMEEALAALEARLNAEPGDIDGWLLLGGAYTSLGRFADAALAYQRALQLSGGTDVTAKLGLAEALVLLDPDQGAGQASRLVDEALAAEPQNPKGLWYGGLLARAGDDDALAISRWEALLALDPPEQVRGVLERELASLRVGSASGDVVLPTAGPRVGVRVSIDPALRGRIQPGASLFVFVRDGGDSGPPLAAVRTDAQALPAEIWVSERDVMLPGRSLVGIDSARLVARVANGGDATARPGDVFGEASWSVGDGAKLVELVINQVYEP